MDRRTAGIHTHSCPLCNSRFIPWEQRELDRRPMTICTDGHSVCASCVRTSFLKSTGENCPLCRQTRPLSIPVYNESMIELLRHTYENATSRTSLPRIENTELVMEMQSFAFGGFADVYRAKWHTQEVVVKVLRKYSFHDQQELRNDVYSEAALVLDLRHPNIVQVFGVCEAQNGQLGIVMEKADYSLNELMWLSPERLPDERKVQISIGIVDGLQYLHLRKVIHRDVKPGNILVFGDLCIAKLTDFGIAQIAKNQQAATTGGGGSCAVTSKYAAPELLQAGLNCTAAVDTFSLALILYELFTGLYCEQELGGDLKEFSASIQNEKRPERFDNPPNFTVPHPVRTAIRNAWKQNPYERASLADVRQALSALLKPDLPNRSNTPVRLRHVDDNAAAQGNRTPPELHPKDLGEQHSWFFGRMTREAAQSCLVKQQTGTFFVRFSSRQNVNVISLKYKNEVRHIKIEEDQNGGFFINKEDHRRFPTTADLVKFYQKNPMEHGNSFKLKKPLKRPVD